MLPAQAAAAPGLPKTATPPADVTGGAPATSAGEASAATLYVINEARSAGEVPRAPAEHTARAAPERSPALASAHPGFDVNAVRRDFPILSEKVHGRPLIWFDNAATTQKPRAVIDRLSYFYEHENSNIHRAAHEVAARATDAYEAARDKVARFLHAASSDEIVFVRGTTEAINLVAQSWGRRHIGPGDEIVITWLEHHANIVPWQQLCAEKGARLRVAPVDDDGQVRLDEYETLLGPRTKLAAFSQVSNALGTITPAREMVEIAHRYGARVLVDGAQSVSHLRVDLQALDCDWFVFSGHKIFGPTGIGALYGKGDLLNSTPPWQGGGNMIQDVTFERTVYQPAPARFEAGTGNIADAVGLGAALDYLERVGRGGTCLRRAHPASDSRPVDDMARHETESGVPQGPGGRGCRQGDAAAIPVPQRSTLGRGRGRRYGCRVRSCVQHLRGIRRGSRRRATPRHCRRLALSQVALGTELKCNGRGTCRSVVPGFRGKGRRLASLRRVRVPSCSQSARSHGSSDRSECLSQVFAQVGDVLDAG